MEKKTWKEFRAVGLLWFVNKFLHLIGWVLVVVVDDETGDVTECYPARCSLIGFEREHDVEGFKVLRQHLADNSERLEKLASETYD